jgi:hypothetical protein
MMQAVAQRVGILVRQRKKTKGFKIRFFVVDNECNLLYTQNLAFIERLMRTSETIGEIVTKCTGMKKISFKNAKIGPLRLFYTIDSIPLANKNCFEMFIENSSHQALNLILFSYQDDLIVYMHDFFKNYNNYVSNKTGLNQPNPIKKALQAGLSQEEEKEILSSLKSGDSTNRVDDDLKEKLEALWSLEPKDSGTNDLKKLSEDLLQAEKAVEDKDFLQLSNGNSFSGKTLNGKPTGQGKEFFKDGTSYVGEFRNGRWHGTGYVVNSKLDMTYAEFMSGKAVGI